MANEHLYRKAEVAADGEILDDDAVLMWVVQVKSICIEHWLPPIRGREFCAGGTEHDMGDWWEWDCNIRKVPDGD